MGILVSEINGVTFRHRVLTFESKPRWVQLNDAMSLEEKVRTTKNAPWVGSTNFYAAMQLIATVVETHRLAMEEVPDLIVFSDMQFDDAGFNNCFTTSACESPINHIQRLASSSGIFVVLPRAFQRCPRKTTCKCCRGIHRRCLNLWWKVKKWLPTMTTPRWMQKKTSFQRPRFPPVIVPRWQYQYRRRRLTRMRLFARF